MKKFVAFAIIFSIIAISSIAIAQTSSISNNVITQLENNANAAEPMTILGIYVHGFFLLMAVGLPYVVLSYEALGIKRKDKEYLGAAKKLSRVWGISFAIGAATGTLVEFGLVQLWSGTLVAIGSFFFSFMTIELFAFMLEVIFIVLYLFTWNVNNPSWKHFFAGVILLVGSNLSAYLILGANAFMNVPWGTGTLVSKILPWEPALGPNAVNQQALANLYIAIQNKGTLALINYTLANNIGIILNNQFIAFQNPDLTATFLHTVLATIIIASFEASAFIAWDWIKKKNERAYRFKLLKVSYGVGAVASILMAFSGDYMGRVVYEYNRLKFLAFENFSPNGGTDPIMGLLLYLNPNHFFHGFNYYLGLAGQSIDPNAAISSITYAESFQAWAYPVYWSMVISGILLFIFAIAYIGVYFKPIEKLVNKVLRISEEKFLVYTSFIAPFLGLIAASAGWAVREAGRHPWAIYGLIQYWQVITPNTITPAFSALIILVELLIFIFGIIAIIYVMRYYGRDKK
ncbi:MAG: cytochrome ubiquinol oxidase subunit I [Thermoplasmata archaeon]|nr:cytochrome ubiquinol oxidase subunit I [Thermoplasmata archaeon]